MQRLAGVAETIEAARTRFVAGPAKEAAGIELAIDRMEAAAHHARRSFTQRNTAHAALWHAIDLFVRHGK